MIDLILLSVLALYTPYFEDLGYEVIFKYNICNSIGCYDELVLITEKKVYFTPAALDLTNHDKYGLNMFEHAFWHIICKCNWHEGDDEYRSNQIYPDEVTN